jgi:small-conductance mechanosensitive channel
MILFMRRILAVISACGLAGSIASYVASYFGSTMDSLWHRALLLHLGVFILVLPMFALEHSSIKNNVFFWKGFKEGRPAWTVFVISAAGLFFLFHFAFFLIQSHAASPQIEDGDYVLDDHGQIIKILTHGEYLVLKGAELRIFATGWLFFYLILTMYWGFPKVRQLVF